MSKKTKAVEVVEVESMALTIEDADAITVRIKDAAQQFAAAALDLTKAKTLLFEAVEEAQSSESWKVLGFKSWTAYIADVFGGLALPSMSKDEQKAMVEFLWAQGMSVRAIAPITGQSPATVGRVTKVLSSKDLRASEKRMVMGLDGKTRHTPKPKPVSEDDADDSSKTRTIMKPSDVLPKVLADLNGLDFSTLTVEEATEALDQIEIVTAELRRIAKATVAA